MGAVTLLRGGETSMEIGMGVGGRALDCVAEPARRLKSAGDSASGSGEGERRKIAFFARSISGDLGGCGLLFGVGATRD